MKKWLSLNALWLLLMIPTPSLAMTGEFQKPTDEDDIDDTIYTTPEHEDTGELIEEQTTQQQPEQQPTVQPNPQQQPVQQQKTPPQQAPVEQTDDEPITSPTEQSPPPPLQTEQQNIQQQSADEETTEQETIDNIDTTDTQAPQQAPIKRIVEEEVDIQSANNFFIWAIGGGAVLLVIVLLLFNRLGKNNPYR